MQKQLNAVKLFHETYGLGVSEEMKADLGTLKNELRFNLMKEENEEYLEAVQNNDIVEVADALGDMLYILCGTILEHGLQHKIEEVFDEIQRSNNGSFVFGVLLDEFSMFLFSFICKLYLCPSLCHACLCSLVNP